MGTTEISKIREEASAYSTESVADFIKRCKEAYDSDDASKLVTLDISRLKSYTPKNTAEKVMVQDILGTTSLNTLKNWANANINNAYDPIAQMASWNAAYDRWYANNNSAFTEIWSVAEIKNATYTEFLNLSTAIKNSPYTEISDYKIKIPNKATFESVQNWTVTEWGKVNPNAGSGGNTSVSTPVVGGFSSVSGTGGQGYSPDFKQVSQASFAAITGDTLRLYTYGDGSYWRVIADSVATQIYCAAKGGTLSGHGASYWDVRTRASEVRSAKCGCASEPGYLESYPYYFKYYSRPANLFEAFILTWSGADDKGWNAWDPVKQEAVWDTPSLSNNKHAPKETSNGVTAETLAAQALCYQDFITKIRANNNTILVGDKTVQEEVEKYANYATKEYVIGPFNIDYITGDYGIVFGGISDMYIKGENSERIEIESIILGDSITGAHTEVKTNFFVATGNEMKGTMAQGATAIQDRGQYNLVDIYSQSYPDPNQNFYVKYIASEDEKIEKLHVDFAWMEAEAEITYYNAIKYRTEFTHHHDKHTHDYTTGTGHHKTRTCRDCEITGKVVPFYAGYQVQMSAEGRRWLRTTSLEIPIPSNGPDQPYEPGNPSNPSKPDRPNDNEPPSTPKNLQIRLAGHVWEDEKTGKESLPNGTLDIGENFKSGVEVFLYYENGTLVQKDVNGQSLQNPTVTDVDGYYEFNALNAQSKYYIEFVYDGQIYQATQYQGINLSGGYSNASEVNSERLAYNNHFAEINSAPGNYVVRRSLYYSAGQTNTAYIIDKPSTETPYGIKEMYEYLIVKATETKSYAKAYEETLNAFGNNESTKSKLQFIEDCRISSYTGLDTSKTLYPIYDQFVEGVVSKNIGGIFYHALYPEHLKIDFGLTRRETFDLALRKDVQKATIEINGKSHTYTYDTRNNADETDDGTWDIGVRLSDRYYDTGYSRELFGEDFQYKANMYNGNPSAYGKSQEDELNVYITYKLTVRNQSQSILGEVMEIVDYYDEDYEYIDERSYIEIKNGNNSGLHEIKAYDNSRYGSSNETDLNGYDAVYVRGLEGIKLTSGQTAYVYLTFKVKKDNVNNENWIRLDEQVESAAAIGVGKENIAEINGFKTYYRNGTTIPNVGNVSGSDKAAGLFDVDSVPGNINQNDVPKDGNINYNNFEDDTDKAPNIRLILYRENGELLFRQIDGIVWEDERTEDNKDQVTSVGDGIKQDKETGINGVTVQLVELMENGTEYVWKTFSSGQGTYDPIINIRGGNGNPLIPSVSDGTAGKYVFKSYMPGNYVVRFIYGDTIKTVLPQSNEVTNAFGYSGQNSKSYNGQDYKSTTYQEGIAQNKEYTWRRASTWQNGQEILGEELTRIQTFKPDYSNNETANATVAANNQKGYLYDITASDVNANVSDAKDIMTDDNLNKEFGRQSVTLNSREDVISYSDKNVMNYIAEVLASHEKLPLNRSELNSKLSELMAETQMTAETGLMNIEIEYDRNATGDQVQNNPTYYQIHNVNLGLEERPKAQLSLNKEVTNVKLTLADGSTLFDATQKATNVLWRDHKPHAFKYNTYKLEKDPMAEIRDKNTYDVQYGLIQLSMDEELMHGATIKISYKITVTNVGEVDYKENSFYYTGNVADKNTVVKTIANQLVDYVANNLQFYAVDNEAWQVITQDELLNGPVNMVYANETAKYNTVITTSEKSNIAKTELVPIIYDSERSQVSDDLVLTQLITSENDTDDLTYRNIVEIVRTSNDVGRRNAYSVAGNQNPISDITEVDTDIAQIVKILPPYGNAGTYYIIAATVILASAILITGIIFIKKKVLR